MAIDPRLYGYTPPDPNKDLSAGIGENHASQIGAAKNAASYAQMGAKIGSIVPGLGTLAGLGIGAGVGAIKGWAQGRTNDTKNQREDFAHTLGVGNTTDLWTKLHQALSPDVADELQNRATARIGKHDTTANQQWMQDVQAALNAGTQQQAAQQQAQQPTGPVAAPVDPRRQSVLDALKGGGNYRDALVAYLGQGGR